MTQLGWASVSIHGGTAKTGLRPLIYSAKLFPEGQFPPAALGMLRHHVSKPRAASAYTSLPPEAGGGLSTVLRLQERRAGV